MKKFITYIKQLADTVRQIFLIIKIHYKLKPKQIVSSLSQFYTQSADKRVNTRKKDWPEFEIILKEVEKRIKRQKEVKKGNDNYELGTMSYELKIIELGCGDGRFAEYLDEHLGIPFRYIGVDCSYGLIDYAQKRTFSSDNEVQFVVGDMVQYMSLLEQQSVDIVVSIASIQHVHHSMRTPLWNQVSRILNYDGLFIASNRSYSKWMLSKHLWKTGALIAGFILQLINHKTFGRGDYIIPFKEVEKVEKVEKGKKRQQEVEKGRKNGELRTQNSELRTSYRFYHIFLLGSLIQYARSSGMRPLKACYVSSDGQLSDSWWTSRNSFLVAQKDILG